MSRQAMCMGKGGKRSVSEEHKEKGPVARDERMLAGWLPDTPTRAFPGDWDQILHLSRSHTTSKTFKWSSLLLQIKLQGCVRVCLTVLVSVSAWEGWEKKKEEASRGGKVCRPKLLIRIWKHLQYTTIRACAQIPARRRTCEDIQHLLG